MPIHEQDIKLLKSQVMEDVPEGGGASTGEVIDDNVSNNIFSDVPELSRVIGDVSLRLAYLGVQTPDTDVYRGARVIIGKPPGDPRVAALLFQPAPFDRRTDMRRRIENYLSRGPKWPGYLYDNHIEGQRAVVLLQREGSELPSVGKTLVLVGNEGQGTEYEQFVRVTKVGSVVRDFTVADGSGTRNFRRQVVTCEISDALRYDFFGVEATDLDAGQAFVGKAVVRDTVVADAARYYGAAPLVQAAALGDLGVKAAAVHAALVPSAQTETPIVDAQPNQAITGALASAGTGVTSVTTSAAFDSTHALYVGGSILPGSLSVTGAASLTDRAGRLVDVANSQVGTVDYVNGVLTLAGSASYPGTKVISYRLGADPGTASQSMAIPVTPGNRGSAWTFVLDPVPAAASLRVSYLSGGRWYVLSDSGDGSLRGADTSYGAGQLNRTSGSVAVTLGALPDTGSKILVTWAPSTTVSAGQAGAVRAYFEVVMDRPVSAGSITISWDDGSPRSVTDSAGQLAGDGIGSIDYQTGRFRLSPTLLPAPGTVFSVALADAAAGTSGPITLTDGGSVLTGSLAAGVAAGSLYLTVTVQHSFASELYDAPASDTYTLVDEAGAIKAVMGDGTRSTSIGTINYSTGAISIAKAIPDFITYAFRHYAKSTMSFGGVSAEDYTLTGSRTEGCTGQIVTAGASARYTTGTGAGGSATFACGDLFIPDNGSMGSTWRNIAYVPGGYVSKSFSARMGSHQLVTQAYQTSVYIDPPVSTSDWGSSAGYLDVGRARLHTWPAGQSSSVDIVSAAGTYGGLTVDRAVYRFPVAPLRPASVTVSATTVAGVAINATADASGVINSADMVGRVDFSTGIVEVVFTTSAGTEASPWVINVSALGLAGVSTVKAGHVRAASIRLAGVAYTYLPIPADIVGLDPVRLPSDGRVPIFRPGDVAIVHHTAATDSQAVANGQTVDVGRTRLSRIRVLGNDGAVISAGYSANTVAGTVTFSNVAGYAQPVTIEHMIKDEVVVSDALISGDVLLARPLSHAYPLGSIVSSALLVGSLFARVPLMFDQQTWTGVWSDDLIGSAVSANYNTISHPPVITNIATVTERWAIVFTNTTTYRLIGEHLGVIADGVTTTDFAPLNPAVGLPYFTIPAAGWGGGWASGNVIRLNTVGALHPLGFVRTIQQGDATLDDDSFTVLVLGDRDKT